MLTDFFKKKIKINISLPNFHNQVFLNLCFITLQENNKSVFKNNFEISSAEGCFPYSIWSSVREQRYITKHDMETTLSIYSKHNINVNYIFDNNSISKEDLNDNFSNLMLKSAHKEGNGIYVKSDILFDYIKKKYPHFKLIKIADENDFQQKDILISDKYNNILRKNDIKFKENAYITLNPLCPSDCRHYENHKKYLEQEQLNYYGVSDVYVCPLKRDFNFYDLKNNPNFISEERMQSYIKAGFSHFRIDFPYIEKSIDINYGIYDTIESYIYYLIKPEYRDEIRHIIIKKFAGNRNG